MRESKIGVLAAVCLFAVEIPLIYGQLPTPTIAETEKLGRQVAQLDGAGRYSDAIPAAAALLELRQKSVGPDSPETASSLNKLADLYRKLGDYTKAETLFQRALRIRERTLGPEHPDTAQSLNSLGDLYENKGDYAKAESFYQHAFEIRQKVLGPQDAKTAESLNGLATVYIDIGGYAKAEPLLQRALRIYEKTLGPEHPSTAAATNDLAFLYLGMGDHAKAEPLFQRALKIDEKTLGPEHPQTASHLNNLASLYREMGEYTKAEPLIQSSLKAREKVLGPEHPATAESLNNLASLYDYMGDYAKAEPLFQRALKIREQAFGPEHPNIAESLNNLAILYLEMSEYAKAEPLLQRALKIFEKALGPEHPSTATSLNQLAFLYREMGDYAKAEPLLQRALKIFEKALGPEHPSTATGLNNLAFIYREVGDYQKAEPLYKRALEIDEKALGLEHPSTAIDLKNMARLYREVGDYQKAEPLYKRALEIDEKTLGPEHPSTAIDLENMARLYLELGDYAKAEPLFQRALRIDEKALGREHPNTAIALTNLALLKIADGNQKAQAIDLMKKWRNAEAKYVSNILSFTSEQQRLAFQQTIQPYNLAGTLGEAQDLAEIVLRQKAVVLDSLLEDRLVAEASADLKQRAAVSELRSAKQRFMKQQLEVPEDVSDAALKKRDAEKEELSQRIEELEAGLARQVGGLGRARRALSVTVPQVQAALGKDETLIEFMRYQHYLGKNKFEPRYGAVLIPPKVEPKWVPLGAAHEIEKNIQLYQKSARGQTDEPTLSSVLHGLHGQIWDPIEKALPAGTKTVVFSPDAELSFVSFAILVGPDDKFVGEKYSVRYVASGRDLLREFKTSSKRETNVYANPDFGGKPVSVDSNRRAIVALRAADMHDLQNISLRPLPGTEVEAAALQKRLGTSAKIFLGRKATKAQLQQMDSPRIVHLATHGFFLPEIDFGGATGTVEERAIPKGKLVNPMHRSGLALAGAQTTLQAWSRGESPPIENNGIVTAEEVGGLKLDGTWLVVLSACDTGGGEARAGEGVMGLRRGFVQAGAQNLLMTLWPIGDETTVNIMLDFYDAAFKTGNAPQALADTQRDWLVKLRKERGLLPAVQLAGPFIMSSQGKP